MYHKVTFQDCLEAATKAEAERLKNILDISLLKELALKWCEMNGYKLGGYLGHDCWDASKGGDVYNVKAN